MDSRCFIAAPKRISLLFESSVHECIHGCASDSILQRQPQTPLYHASCDQQYTCCFFLPLSICQGWLPFPFRLQYLKPVQWQCVKKKTCMKTRWQTSSGLFNLNLAARDFDSLLRHSHDWQQYWSFYWWNYESHPRITHYKDTNGFIIRGDKWLTRAINITEWWAR